MRTKTRIVGIGQPIAGDDAVGIVVARRLREHGLTDSVEVLEIFDPLRLIELLEESDRAILIDAVVGNAEPGRILCLDPNDLPTTSISPVSSHTLDLTQVLALAHLFAARTEATEIQLIGIAIEPPERHAIGLSPPIRAAVPKAVAVILEMLNEPRIQGFARKPACET